jgi:hypothetical protein
VLDNSNWAVNCAGRYITVKERKTPKGSGAYEGRTSFFRILNIPHSSYTVSGNLSSYSIRGILFSYTVRGASELKKVNKKRTVTVRRVIIFLNISRHPLLICLHCFLHQYKTQKAVATPIAAIVLLTPAKNLNKVFWGVSSGLPLV